MISLQKQILACRTFKRGMVEAELLDHKANLSKQQVLL
jgi:hypothetical protein